ncbi:MAG: chemotaxis protein CheW [Myxococcales bacterium]|nr:chemotaxis protein CheW [Myxococcales bacterium]MDH5305668.1 chemotaxis protein CheW [Myxococcales bacterium]MDH5567113.1 chemotaxis protein CheW [Myxococcales bacterium]
MTTSDEARLLTFEIGRSLFAMPIAGVLEVTERGVEACVPTVPARVASVINYRGDALPVIRRGQLLELDGMEASEPEHILVISDGPTHAARLGLEVDRVLGLIDGEGATSRGPDPIAERRPIGGRLAHVLDPARLIARAREVIETSLTRSV